VASNVVKVLVDNSYVRDFVDIEDISFTDYNTILLSRINVNSTGLDSLPFIVRQLSIESATISWTNGTLRISGCDIHLVVDVSKCPVYETTKVDSCNVGETNRAKLDENYKQKHARKTVVISDMDDAIAIVRDAIHNIVLDTMIMLENIKVSTISNVTMIDTEEHTMSLTMTSIQNSGLLRWKASQTHFCVCSEQPTALLDTVSIDMDPNGYVVADFSECGFIPITMCGDSGFLFTMFLQQLMENQRQLMESRNLKSECKPVDDEILARRLSQSMSDCLFADFVRPDRHLTFPSSSSRSSTFEIAGLRLRNIDATVELFKGSDLEKRRSCTDRVTLRVWNGCFLYDVKEEHLTVMVDKVQTTVGYIDDVVSLRMKRCGDFWDADIHISDVYIRTSQDLMDKIVVLFTFNSLYNECVMLYNVEDVIKFRKVIVNDVYVRFKYYNSPVNYRKLLTGNWKTLARLIPHCDVSLTFPNVVIQYQVGWDDLFDAYLKEMFVSQRVKCIKKVILGTAKRKLRSFVRRGIL